MQQLKLSQNADSSEEKQIDVSYAAFKLLTILFKEGLINFDTYQNILRERKENIK